jgi:hypothetical protein
MKQAISFSLYGSEMRYLVGAIKNAIIAQQLFDDEYELIFFIGESVPQWVQSTLLLFPNVRVIDMAQRREDSTARLWRFIACSYDYDVVMFRDCDARLSIREKMAHEQWLDSGLDAHIMKDHAIGHNYTINAGMFSVKSELFQDMPDLIEAFAPKDTYTQDQEFLAQVVFPRIQFSCLVHDEFFNTKVEGKSKLLPYPTKPPTELSHIGAALDENDVYVFDVDRKKAVEQTGSSKYQYEWGQ